MATLSFHLGPLLIYGQYGVEIAAAGKTNDVTRRTVQYLFESVALNSAFTLDDLRELLKANDGLQKVFRRDYAVELCVEASQGSFPQSHEYGAGGFRHG